MLNAIDINTVITSACPTPLAASFSFSSPSLKDRFAAAPFPIKPAIALNTITNGNITFVAAFPNVPTPFPINIWSTIL